MDIQRREQLRHSLRSLAEAYAANMSLMQRTFALLEEELALDPLTYLQTLSGRARFAFLIDRSHFSVRFHGKTCFLGNTLSFHFLERLAVRPQEYVPYEDLLTDVWRSKRSDETVRSLVKMLRRKLRKEGMAELANAIDGSVSGHYALMIERQQ